MTGMVIKKLDPKVHRPGFNSFSFNIMVNNVGNECPSAGITPIVGKTANGKTVAAGKLVIVPWH
jgi:hypothetical protein